MPRNKEKKSAYDKLYRKDHKLEAAAYKLVWYKDNRDRILAASRTPKGRFAQFIRNARCTKHEMTLIFEDYIKLITSNECYYCGGPLNETGCGLDRIDSNKGYVLNNVRPCCDACNTAKNNYTEIEFKNWAVRLYKKWACSAEIGD